MAARILVVDDNKILLENLSLALSAAGYCVVTADDGRVALDLLRAQRVDLIIANIAMDRANGQALYDYARQGLNLSGVPLILLGGYDAPAGRWAGRPQALHLAAPIQPEELLEAVRWGLRPAGREAEKGEAESSPAGPGGPVGR